MSELIACSIKKIGILMKVSKNKKFKYLFIILLFFQINRLIADDTLSIKYIELFYDDYSIYSEGRITIYEILNKIKTPPLFKKRINDSTLLIKFEHEIDKKKNEINIEACTDYRCVLKIFRINGRCDTLAIGECFVYFYNNKFYKPNLNLFNLIFSEMDDSYLISEDYYWYLNELKKYFEE